MYDFSPSPRVNQFFKNGRPEYCQKGQILMGMDPTPNGVYLLDTGFVKFYSITNAGDEFIHIVYGHGDIFPLTWAYLNTRAEMYCETLDNVLLWHVSKEQFAVFAQTDRRFSYGLACHMAYQLQLFADRLDNLEYRKAGERVAYRLLYLAARFGERSGKHITIVAPLTHELIANSINIARESASRELEKLNARGIIRTTNHHITILSVERLRQRLSEPASFKQWNLE